MKLVYLDVETTGLDPQKNSIFQLSGIIKSELGEEEFNYYIRPYRDDTISDMARMKTGKSQAEIEAYPDQKEAYDSFIALLDKHDIGSSYDNKAFIVGYNATDFDMPFLRSWFEFNGNNKFGYRISYPSLDSMHLAALYLAPVRSTMRNFQLTTVYEKIFGEEFTGAHDSMEDVKATKRLFDFLSSKMLSNLIQPNIPVRKLSN